MVYNFKPLIMFVHESTFLMNKMHTWQTKKGYFMNIGKTLHEMIKVKNIG